MKIYIPDFLTPKSSKNIKKSTSGVNFAGNKITFSKMLKIIQPIFVFCITITIFSNVQTSLNMESPILESTNQLISLMPLILCGVAIISILAMLPYTFGE